MLSTVLIIALAILVNSLVLGKVSLTLHGSHRSPVRRQAMDTTTSSRVVDTVTSRHVALHS